MSSKKILTLFMMCVVCVFAGVIFAQEQWRVSSFVDERDGQTYRAVVMPDGKTWMAQNLNFETESGTGSWCYDNDVDNCEIYGRLYNWNTAMTACPAGWRLPSNEDWLELVNTVSDSLTLTASGNLKSRVGWNEGGNGTDVYGFSAMPGGYSYPDSQCELVGYHGFWWTSTTVGNNCAMYHNIGHRMFGGIGFGTSAGCNPINEYGFSVRCVRE